MTSINPSGRLEYSLPKRRKHEDNCDGQLAIKSPSLCPMDTDHEIGEPDLRIAQDGQSGFIDVYEDGESSVNSLKPRKHQCPVCRKTFTQKHHLTAHSRCKPFMCSVCHKMFTRQTMVEVHMKMHRQMTGSKRRKSFVRDSTGSLKS